MPFASAADPCMIPARRLKSGARENCNQSIALRKCDSHTDLIRMTRQDSQLSYLRQRPLSPRQRLCMPLTPVLVLTTAPLSFHCNIRFNSIITKDSSTSIANFSNLPHGRQGNVHQCIQKSGVSTITAPCERAHEPQSAKPAHRPSGRWASPLRMKRAPRPIRYSRMGGAG